MRNFVRSYVRLLHSPHLRELVLLEMETSLLAMRSGDPEGLVRRERRDFKTYGRLLDEIADRRGEPMPFPGETWMFLMQVMAKGLAYQRLRDPKSVPDAAVEAMLMTLVTVGDGA